MSGFEVAGIILGVIPIFISGLKYCRAGKEVVCSPHEWRIHLGRLVTLLKLHQDSFGRQIHELLRSAEVEDAQDYMTKEELVGILRDAKHETKVRNYLGGLYADFETALRRYEQYFKDIASKLKRLHRIQDAARDDLIAVLEANKPGNRRSEIRKAVIFTIERNSLDMLIKNLDGEQDIFKRIIDSKKHQQNINHIKRLQSRDPSRSHALMLKELSLQVQSAANLLSRILRESIACGCSSHRILMRLDSRLLPIGNYELGAPRGQIAFNLVFIPFLSGFDLLVASANPSRLQPIVIKPTLNNNNASPLVTNICKYTVNAQSSNQVPELRLSHDGLRQIKETHELRREVSAFMTLDRFLRDNTHNPHPQMITKQKAVLILQIAASIFQLRQTSWFGSPFKSKSVRLIQTADETELEPFVEQLIETSQQHGDIPEGPSMRCALIELAIIVLEIWHHKPLEDWKRENGIDLKNSEWGRMEAAQRWIASSNCIPIYQSRALRGCLGIITSPSCCWHDDDLLVAFCDNIIKPLQQSCMACLDSNWCQKMMPGSVVF
ncbi:hypothetical protein F5Y04DRAFT_261355 [Hypomontagnella monticulosa]|nr:hypothetical protein F5Y04DRAFT_261355 [Hypomontagnella monticulosa]